MQCKIRKNVGYIKGISKRNKGYANFKNMRKKKLKI